jgi:Mg-chelatase subunit ChlD
MQSFRLAVSLVICVLAVTAPAADEEELISQYNSVIRSLDADKFGDARKELDAFEATAKSVKEGDPAYKRAQELLKRADDLRIASYQNSAIKAKNAANQAVDAVKLDSALTHLTQFAADSTELARLRPKEKRYQEQLNEGQQQLAQVKVAQSLLAGKPIDPQILPKVEATKPLFRSAPGFSLPQLGPPKLVSPLDTSGQVVVLQLFQADHATASLAAETARALKKQFSSQGLQVVSIGMDEGESLAKLDEFVSREKPNWPVVLNDHGDFQEQYLKGSYRLPGYIVIGRDRRAWAMEGTSPLETTAQLAAKVHEEVGKSSNELPRGPVDAFAVATPFPATRVATAEPATISFGDKPALMVIAFEPKGGPYLSELAVLGKKYGERLKTLAVVRSDQFAKVRELAEAHEAPFYQVRWGVPECYGPNFSARLVVVSRGGRVLKVTPLSDNPDHVREVMARYTAIVADAGSYPSPADTASDRNLAQRLAGGIIRASSANPKGSEQRLNDGIAGGPVWEPQGALPQEIDLVFLNGRPALFDRLIIDRRAGLGLFEVLVAQSADGEFRSLGRYQADERESRQAFELPPTEAAALKVRLLEDRGERPQKVALGEIEIIEAGNGEISLAKRLAAHHVQGGAVKADFSDGLLSFWEQTDFVFGLGDTQWRSQQGHLEASGLPQMNELRASALLHTSASIGDLHLSATLRSRGNGAAGIVFGFRDWDNHLRVVLVQGNVQTGRSVGNSIRLERWHQGQLEVLGVHGEAFPHGEAMRLEVLRQGARVAVTANNQVILASDRVAASPGRFGFCAAGGGDFEVDDVTIAPLTPDAPWRIAPLRSLTTAAGASLAWLNRQGDDQHPQAWASNLLRNPVFSPRSPWEATRSADELPEAMFAIGESGSRTVEEVEFELPAPTPQAAKNLVRKAEVLVSNDSPLDAASFRSLGQFTLRNKSGPQRFAIKSPAAGKHVKLRLLENGGGDQFSLAGFDVHLGDVRSSSPNVPLVATARGVLEKAFQTPAQSLEKEPNDKPAQANLLRNVEALDGQIQVGETDLFELPPPPPSKGLKSLRVTLDALPWLRLKAALCDDAGNPLDPPLTQFAAGQHAEQVRQIGPNAKTPRYVRIEMPPASLAVVLDTSGSMGGREEDVRSAVKSYLAGAADTEQIEVIEFNSEVNVLGRLPEDRQKVDEAVERLRVTGNTALYEALLAGMEKNQAVILLSDGMNTVFKADFTDLCRRLAEKPVPIYVVGIGWDLHEYDANSGNTAYSLLQNLARQTGGQFYFSPDSQKLETLYRQIAAEVRGNTRYRLRAQWDVSEGIVELARIVPALEHPRGPLSLPLPPEPGELALGGFPKLNRGPIAASMPPTAEPDLAPPPTIVRAKSVASFPLPILSNGELATVTIRSQPGPRALSLPELCEVSITYKPPKAGDPPLPAAVLPAFELIFDSSESMSDRIQGQMKIEIARKVIGELAEALPANAQVGLRLYGHWGPWIARKTDPKAQAIPWEDARLNTDSDLVVPIGLIDAKQRAELKRWINWTQPRGKTPMVYSLLQARNDFSEDWKGPRTLILVSDGVETCGGKLEDLVKAFQGSGIEAVIHVVGFDIAGTDAEKQLREIAKIGSGEYYAARDAKELSAALKKVATAGAFTVHDESGALAGKGTINGESLPLLPGRYSVRLQQVNAEPLKIDVTSPVPLRFEMSEEGSLQAP